jgi:hypothetical protein
MLAGVWRNSWRNSDQTLESRDGCSKRLEDGLVETPRKTVSFPEEETNIITEIPDNDDYITREEIQESWYKVSSSVAPRTIHLGIHFYRIWEPSHRLLFFLDPFRKMTTKNSKRIVF